VTTLHGTFSRAAAFNQPLTTWDTSRVTDRKASVSGPAAVTYGEIGTWDVSAVTDLSYVFCAASWHTSRGCNTACSTFNSDIDNWDTSRVTTLAETFYIAVAFNQPLTTWDTSLVTTLARTFYGAAAFNQPLTTWNTSRVTTLTATFDNTPALSECNKALIHAAFSSNSLWTYSWGGYICPPPAPPEPLAPPALPPPSLPPPLICGSGTSFNPSTNQCEIACDDSGRRMAEDMCQACGAHECPPMPTVDESREHGHHLMSLLAEIPKLAAVMDDDLRERMEHILGDQHFGQPTLA